MTKADLVSQITEKTGIAKEDVEKIIESFFATIKNSLSQGENIYFRGFGSFIIRQRAAKTARNISEKTTIVIPAHQIPFFKPADHFISQVKEGLLVK
jgi:DNA-binding protein HU-beta